jgi:hypothetical protein
VDGAQAGSRHGDDVAVADRLYGRARGRVRAPRSHDGLRAIHDGSGSVAVIGVAMGDHDRRDLARCVRHGIDVGAVLRRRVDHDPRPLADDVGVRAGAGHGPGIGSDHDLDQRREARREEALAPGKAPGDHRVECIPSVVHSRKPLEEVDRGRRHDRPPGGELVESMRGGAPVAGVDL